MADAAGTDNGGRGAPASFKWPDEGVSRIPDWVYTSKEIYDLEQERIFRGRTWNFVGLEAEIPKPGDFRRSFVGDTSVVVSRTADGRIAVFQNRCAHRGAEFCREFRGHAKEFQCPYHQWTYDLAGNLIAVPFRRGVHNRGGMPADFELAEHGLRQLTVTTRGGAIFASYHADTEPFADYLGPDNLEAFDVVFSGRPIRVLGYWRNIIPGNWKLYPENLKDPYHGSLLHAFLVTFGLHRADNQTLMLSDPSGRHAILAARRGNTQGYERTKQVDALQSSLKLNEPRLVELKPEFNSPWTVVMQTVWPNLIVQRQSNTLGVRQIVPRGPDKFHLEWIMFGYADDDEEMARHRLRQANLMGPAGFIGAEDGEAIQYVQDGVSHGVPGVAVVEMGGRGTEKAETTATETSIRAMYGHYRQVMGL